MSWDAKELHRLVNQMASEIKEETPCLFFAWKFPPGSLTRYSVITLEARFKTGDRSKQVQIGVEQATHCQIIVVPSPTLENRQHFPRTFTGRYELLCIGYRYSDWFINDHRKSCIHGSYTKR